MTSDDKVGGWVKKAQNHDDVLLEWSLGCPMNTVKSQAVDCLLHPRVFRLFIQGKIDA